MKTFRHVGWPIATPYLVGLSLLIFVPAIAVSVLAFTEFNGITDPRFTGLDNFTRLLSDDLFWLASRELVRLRTHFRPLTTAGCLGARFSTSPKGGV